MDAEVREEGGGRGEAADWLLTDGNVAACRCRRSHLRSPRAETSSGNSAHSRPRRLVDGHYTPSLPALTPPCSSDSSPSRLRCQKPGVFRCSATGLQLEGAGELLYGPRPWNLDFLKRRGLQPAGPLFSFTILSGSFQRLHLPHCCLLTGQFPWGGGGVFRREGAGLPPLTTTPVRSRWGWPLAVGSPRDRRRAGAPPT